MQIGPRPAYQNERGFSPGFQSVRPAIQGTIGNSIAYKYSDIRVKSQDTPNAQGNNTTLMVATSTVSNDYDNTGQSGGFKTVVQFDRPIPIQSAFGNYCHFLFGSSQPGYDANIIAASVTLTTDASPGRIQGVIRVRPITSKFANAALTWNTFISGTPPSMGSAIELTWVDQILNLGTGSPITLLGSSNLEPIAAPRTSIVYGFIMDTKPVLLSGTGPTSLNCTVNSNAANIPFAIAQF